MLPPSGGGHLQLPGDPSDEHLLGAPGNPRLGAVPPPPGRLSRPPLVHVQVVIDTDKTTYSLRLQTQDQLDHMVGHINYALARVFNNSIYA